MADEESLNGHGLSKIHGEFQSKFTCFIMRRPKEMLDNLKPRKKSRAMLFVLIIFMLIGIPTLAIIDTQSGNNRFADAHSTEIDPLKPPPVNFDGIFVTCNVTAIDIGTKSFLTRFNFQPVGRFAIPGLQMFNLPSAAISVVIATQLINFPAGLPMTTQVVNIPIETGNLNHYPFDRFDTEIAVYATALIENTRPIIPVALSIVGAVQSFRTDLSVGSSALSPNAVKIKLTGFRSFTVQFFSLFIFSCMWILGFVVFTLATTLWFRDRKVEPATIGVAGSMLFALPAIRNTQPGVPPIGCTIDLVGFFWAMFLVMVSTSLLMTNYIIKYQREKPVRE